MSYPLHTYTILSYIEAHIKEQRLDYNALEQKIGFSYAYIRDFFKQNTGYTLAQYIRTRKILVSAFELLHSGKSIMDLALKYGFSNHESYTRAFAKVIGMTPSSFRKRKPLMGKSELTPGIYGIGLLRQKKRRSDVIMNQKEKYQNNSSTILYGVPKVEWGTYGGSTPYPICLKACADYLGDNLDYAKALGREFSMLGKTENTTKDEFIHFIRQHIDEGYPCIAQGIIGPPEACIITGYRDNGNSLLGWNFFQNDPAFRHRTV